MKVLRSDLLTGFKNKLFESDVENIDNLSFNLRSNKLVCNFTSKIAKNGFKLNGYIINNIVYDCDRCLEPFSKDNKVNAKLYLSNEVSKIEDNSYETIFLPDQNNSIDLVKTLIEILIIEKPLKNLCYSLCKGLCSSCGKNLNHRTCSCGN